ncbi:MAG: hypothetical protein KGD57_10505 [Candidatus Lokiarchaeota archaeon]|nr:hypothetical protein [Candidatus Lokiarchaeota archaeon]
MASILSKLDIEDLIEPFEYLFELHTHNYIRWDFDFIEKNRNLKRINKNLNKLEKKLNLIYKKEMIC